MRLRGRHWRFTVDILYKLSVIHRTAPNVVSNVDGTLHLCSLILCCKATPNIWLRCGEYAPNLRTRHAPQPEISNQQLLVIFNPDLIRKA